MFTQWENAMKQRYLLMGCLLILSIGSKEWVVAETQSIPSNSITLENLLNPTSQEKCIAQICFTNAQNRIEYGTRNNCTFAGNCHVANGEDIFRWAIGKKETGIYGYSTPDSNPCNQGNNFCAATTGNPASAGRTQFYAASYGPQQVTLSLLFSWLNPKGKTRFNPPPDCLKQSFLDDQSMINALKKASQRRAFGQGLVSGRKVPAATVNEDGSITYPAIPKAIQDRADKLNIGKGENAAEWLEMWQRMAVWERLRQIIEAKWRATGGVKNQAWNELSILSNTPDKINGERKPNTTSEKEYLTLLERLGMDNSGVPYKGIKPYVTGLHRKTPIWAEAANTFGNYALFAGAPPNLYKQLMTFFASNDCYIEAVKQMFNLQAYGYDDNHADPNDSATERWVKSAAKAWNGSSGYADYVWPLYKDYYNKYYGKTEVCEQ